MIVYVRDAIELDIIIEQVGQAQFGLNIYSYGSDTTYAYLSDDQAARAVSV